jgi:hypothetical protein
VDHEAVRDGDRDVSHFEARPRFEIIGYDRVELAAPLVYVSDRVGRVVIPEGFVCDLASVPHWMASLAPSWSQTAGAGIVHDYLYRTGKVSRRQADAVLYEALRAPPATGRFRAWAMWAAVRVFGWGAWTCNRIASCP